MIFYLHPRLRSFFSSHISLFDQLMNLRGEVFRNQKKRLTQQVLIGDKFYFIKQYNGISIKEILKNCLSLRWPVISASNEWQAIYACQQLGIRVPKVLAYGSRGWNPLTRQSFILMEALTPTKSLEELISDWQRVPPTFAEKRQLIAKVADIARKMHGAGINHRDFYLCHFLISLPIQMQLSRLYLIDLHRAQIRYRTPRRWIIKDLAALYFSSKGAGLTKRDLYRFIKYYLNQSKKKSLHAIFRKPETFWQQVESRGEQLYRDHT